MSSLEAIEAVERFTKDIENGIIRPRRDPSFDNCKEDDKMKVNNFKNAEDFSQYCKEGLEKKLRKDMFISKKEEMEHCLNVIEQSINEDKENTKMEKQEQILISRDKKNPTWAWVWYCSSAEDQKNKRILLDVLKSGSGCIVVDGGFELNYQSDDYYEIQRFDRFELIKEPTYRPFKYGAEFIQWLKATGRTDMRIESKEKVLESTTGLTQLCHNTILKYFENESYVRASDGVILYQKLFTTYTWFDGSVIGIQE